MAIDLQVGNVVSVILLEDDAEHELATISSGAQQCGLHVFWSESIALPDQDLGSFQMYCCNSRTPTPFELQLIQRVTRLAALAIRHHNAEQGFERFCAEWKGARQRR